MDWKTSSSRLALIFPAMYASTLSPRGVCCWLWLGTEYPLPAPSRPLCWPGRPWLSWVFPRLWPEGRSMYNNWTVRPQPLLLQTWNKLIYVRGIYVPNDERWPAHFRGIGIRIEDSVCVGDEHPIVFKEVCFKLYYGLTLCRLLTCTRLRTLRHCVIRCDVYSSR